MQTMQDLAYRRILSGLQAAGIVQGEVEEMMSANVGALFMPHGGCNVCTTTQKGLEASCNVWFWSGSRSRLLAVGYLAETGMCYSGVGRLHCMPYCT